MAQKQTFVEKGTVVGYDYPSIGKSVRVDLSKLTEEVREQLMVHGAKQRLGDAASGQEPKAKYEMASRIVDALLAGQWNVDASAPSTEMIVAAVARIKSLDVEKIRAVATPEKVKDWGSNAKVKAMIATIAAEKANEAATEADDIEIE